MATSAQPVASRSQTPRFQIASYSDWQKIESLLAIEHPALPLWKRDLRWLLAVSSGLQQAPWLLVAWEEDEPIGYLPLVFMNSWLFGKHLVALPYINSAGLRANSPDVAAQLIDRAVLLANQWNVRHLELRHESETLHEKLSHTASSKVHMRMPLPADEETLWNGISAKVRNQIRKGDRFDFQVQFGGAEAIDGFYDVFARNMRDLGTPVFSKRLFQQIDKQFHSDCEFCVVRMDNQPIAAAMLIHGNGITEVPSASSLREHNKTNVNMWMYWQLLKRAVDRQSSTFDFGRSTEGGNTYRFKKQWGAEPFAANWQYYVREGTIGDARPDNPKYSTMIRVWQKLPVWLTRLIGPPIVRGIP